MKDKIKTRRLQIQNLHIIKMSQVTQWLFMHISSVLNVKSHILEAGRVAQKQ